jgi:hypothetical protein
MGFECQWPGVRTLRTAGKRLARPPTPLGRRCTASGQSSSRYLLCPWSHSRNSCKQSTRAGICPLRGTHSAACCRSEAPTASCRARRRLERDFRGASPPRPAQVSRRGTLRRCDCREGGTCAAHPRSRGVREQQLPAVHGQKAGRTADAAGAPTLTPPPACAAAGASYPDHDFSKCMH